jgi:hypothetical protein
MAATVQLQAVALNERLRCKKRLSRDAGREQLESFALARGQAGGLVYSQAAFFFGTCAGRRSNFFSSPSACRCALSDFVRFFAQQRTWRVKQVFQGDFHENAHIATV